ncbi:MAG: hypothetical protein EAZ60_23655 [Oscillatoriales cyanobacterium]|nr:MAG: hypothetical protein EAZ60_23655 [Oscillatoriales cyanobacterium]
MVLKTSGLIPKWCIPRTLAAFKTRIHDLGWECDKQIASAFATTYDFIFFPTFEMYKRVIQKNRILRSKTATSMMNLAGKNPGKPYKTCVALTVPS